MWALSRGRTSVRYGVTHRCAKHEREFDADHILDCDLLQGTDQVPEILSRLKNSNIRDWDETPPMPSLSFRTSPYK